MNDAEFVRLLKELKQFRNMMLFIGFAIGWTTGVTFATVLHAF